MVDSALFIGIAFYNVIPNDVLLVMFYSQVSIKVLYALVSVGPIYYARKLFSQVNQCQGVIINGNL